MDQIAQFLPKYPNIFQRPENILNPYDGNFYNEIYMKKEFYVERLPLEESKPDKPGTLLKHQKIIARFLSSHTLYDGILLLHEPGTGKTCAAVAAIEQIKVEKMGYKGALIFLKGKDLKTSFKKELVEQCTSGQYIPQEWDTKLEYDRRMNVLLNEFYKFNTLQLFAKLLRGISDAEIIHKYSNHIIVIDEVHNLRIKGTDGKAPYDMFWRLLHTAKNCKVLLMSGTPMKDGVEEIAAIMNLILPDDPKQQLPTGAAFLKTFFNGTDSGVYARNGDPLPFYTIKPTMVKKLKKAFKGRISYLKSTRSAVPQIYEGVDPLTKPELGLKYFKVVEDQMSKFQTKAYIEALGLYTKGKDFFADARQAILFVFPDGSYGDSGFKKYVVSAAKSAGKGPKKSKIKDSFGVKKYSISTELRKAITDGAYTTEDKLSNLRKYSAKYAATIEQLLKAREDGKSSFVYSSLVQGSGLLLFSTLLTLFGFTSATGSEGMGDESPRFALITGITANQGELRAMMDRFNSDDNKHGQIISVILGSPKVSEGFSFMNVQTETILTPYWNYSETSQVLARGYRLGSHTALNNDATLQIYQRVSIPAGSDVFNVDLYRYQLSEVKDVSIKGVERIAKEAAFDCALTYKRNRVYGYDGQRLCDYMDCDYSCDGIDPDLLEDGAVTTMMLDYSTYELYYSSKQVNAVIDIILKMFVNTFRIPFEDIKNQVLHLTMQDADKFKSDVTDFEILTALRDIIQDNTIITDKYGLSAYLREENNMYFLVSGLSAVGSLAITGSSIQSQYYTSNPNLSVGNTFQKILLELENKSVRSIHRACSANTKTELSKATTLLPLRVQEAIIEGSISSLELGLNVNVDFRQAALSCYDGSYEKTKDGWISHLLYEDEGILRCLDGKNISDWRNCNKNEISKFIKRRAALVKKLESNPYKYYGITSQRDGDRVFIIRDVNDLETKPTKKHVPKGRNCDSWTISNLTKLVINVLKIPPPDSYRPNASKKELWDSIDTSKYTRENINTMSQEDARRASYWTTQSNARKKKSICQSVLEWFESRKMIFNQTGCIP